MFDHQTSTSSQPYSAPSARGVEIQFPEKFFCLFEPKRYKVFYGGRGGGRSWNFATALLIKGREKRIRVLCVRELQKSITESVHAVLKKMIERLEAANIIPPGFYEVQVNKIIGASGTEFFFEGIKNNTRKIKSYEDIDYCWVEEAVKVSRASWNVLIPTVRKDGSEIWMSFNPELEGDYTYVRFVKEGDEKTSFVVKTNWRDNPFFPQELWLEMLDLRKRDYDSYLNVYEGHCKQIVEGAVYANELRKMTLENRVLTVPWTPEVPVSTFWDLGRRDKTAIWFVQLVSMQYRLIAYYEESLLNVDVDEATGGVIHFVRELQRRGFVYDCHYIPHDARAKRLGTKRSVEEILRGLVAPAKVQIVPKLSITDGINAARMLFPRCYFDAEECADGLNHLRHYKYEVDEEDGEVAEKPTHDEHSHCADAFRYLAVAFKGHKGLVGDEATSGASGILGRLRAAGEALVKSRERAPQAPEGRGWMQ